MGCDIHMFVEVKKGNNWEKVGKIFDYPYYDSAKESKIDEDGYEWNPKKIDNPYTGRNYDLFALLADVRNGHGFAGCDTGNPITPLSMPKGLPKDISIGIKKESDLCDGDGHSHSWFLIEELLKIDKNNVKTQRGWVDIDNYRIFKKKGKPKDFSGGVSGGNIKHISIKEMDKLVTKWENPISSDEVVEKLVPEKLLHNIYTKIEWKERIIEFASEFIDNTIPNLQKLGKSKDVRIVFWFDN